MNDYQAKTICTAVIWVATACIFIFGVFRFHADGLLPVMFWTFIAVVLAVAPAVATQAIWNRSSSEKTADNKTGQPPRKTETGF